LLLKEFNNIYQSDELARNGDPGDRQETLLYPENFYSLVPAEDKGLTDRFC
jgi:hypothetical protein